MKRAAPERTNQRYRTRKDLIADASRLMKGGRKPSLDEVAEAALVSRATAYRYFPKIEALLEALVDEALGPILNWDSELASREDRVDDLLHSTSKRIVAFESTFKAALKLSLEQWARDRAGTLGEEPEFKRGHRVELLQKAIAPLKGELSKAQFARLARALSLTYGLEAMIVLKDIWGLGEKEVQSVARWAARALVKMALLEAKAEGKPKTNGRAVVDGRAMRTSSAL